MKIHFQMVNDPESLCGAKGFAAMITELDLRNGGPAFQKNASTEKGEPCEDCVRIFEEKRKRSGYV